MTVPIHFIPAHTSLVRALADELLRAAQRDFSGHMIILPNQRLQQYLHLELASHVRACIPPRVTTLESVARMLPVQKHLRILQGQEEAIILNALLSEGDYASLKPGMERDLARFFTEFADEAIDPSALDTVRDLISRDVFHDDVHRQHVLDHIDELKTLHMRYYALLQENGLITASEFFLKQAETFDPEQDNHLLPTHIHIAGFGDATCAQIILLKKLLRRPGTHFWLHTDAALLQKHAANEGSGPGQPLSDLLQALDLVLPQPENADRPAHNTLLARAAFDLGTCDDLPEGPAQVTIHEAMSPIDEVKAAVALVRELIRNKGIAPEQIVLCVPDAARYGRLVRSICLKAGVPINYSLAIPFDQTQIGQWLHLFCDLVLEDCPLRTLLDLFNNQYFRSLFGTDRAVTMRGELKTLATKYEIARGLDNFLQAAREDDASSLISLFEKLQVFLTPFAGDTAVQTGYSISEWAERLREFTRACAFENYLAGDPARDAYNLESRAMNHWYSGLQIIERSGEFLHNTLTRFEFIMLLRQNVLNTELRPAGEPFVGVQVMGLLEARNVPAEAMILIGLTEGSFPAKISRELFLAEPMRRQVGLTTFHKREHLQDQQFFHLLAAHAQVHLFYPRQDQDAPFVPSRFLQRLRLVNTRRRGCVPERKAQGLLFRDDFLRIPAIRSSYEAWAEQYRTLQQSVTARKDSRGHFPGAREEIFQRIPGTQLDYLLQCPYRFLLLRAGLRETSLPSDENDARSVGMWLHLICQTFFTGLPERLRKHIPDPELAKGWRRPITVADKDRAIDRLCKLSRALMPLSGGEIDMLLYMEFTGWRAFVEHESERPEWIFNEADFEKMIEQDIVLHRGSETFTSIIDGRIDRLIREQSRVTVLDYKSSKGGLEERKLRKGELSQLVLYWKMLREQEEFRQQDFALEYFVFKDGQPIGLDKEQDISAAWHKLEETWAELLFAILLDAEPFRPVADIGERGSGHCTYCDFSGICRREEVVYQQEEDKA